MKKNFLIILVALGMFACGPSTRIVQSWRDPNVVIDTSVLHKFVVAALLKNETVRRTTEDQMAAMYPGKAVQSYLVLGFAPLKDSEEVYSVKLKSEGYDGVVVMTLVKVEKDGRYVPGSYPAYYGSWRGYYGYAWPNYYDPGYYTTDKTYYVEVTVYSLIRNKLIWTGITSTINPTSGDQLFTGVAKTVNQKMKQEGFLK